MATRAEVMVVDDEAIVCERLREHLAKDGIEAETFTDSKSAIERMGEKSFDVVITDLKMKAPDGLDLLLM